MRTIGLIGGMSWESSAEYYRIINQEVRRRLGGTHSAASLLFSFDFAEIETLQEAGDWEAATTRMIDAARALEHGGADLVVICTNTMHRMADEVADAVTIPLVHIADAVASAIQRDGFDTVGLLGTRYTMEEDFYRGRLQRLHGLSVLIPSSEDRAIVHNVIYEELVRGIVEPASREAYATVMDRLVRRGAQGIVLGCTEIELLVDADAATVPVYPTTRLHAQAAVDLALS